MTRSTAELIWLRSHSGWCQVPPGAQIDLGHRGQAGLLQHVDQETQFHAGPAGSVRPASTGRRGRVTGGESVRAGVSVR